MAFLFTLAIFAYFVFCGRAWLGLFRVSFGHTRSWLLAPSIGLSINVISVLSLNQAGLPVRAFALPLVVSFTLIALIIAVRQKSWRIRGLLPFIMLAMAALLVGAWPMLRYGFNWISYGNDDMTNYCLGAQRMLFNGFYRAPLLSELGGSDYSQYFWFMHVVGWIRPGSEILLAEFAGAFYCSPDSVFMPVIFALALTQLWALGAVVYTLPRQRITAMVSCLILAVLPLWSFGTLYQLIAQVSGIALLLSTFALIARRRFASGWPGQLRQACVIAIPTSGVAVIYPEIIPFLVLGLILFTAIIIVRKRKLIPGQIAVGVMSFILLCIILRQNVLSTYITVIGQAKGGLTAEEITKTIFPYFLVPKGFSFLLGFEAIPLPWSEPWGSISIAGALCLSGLIIFRLCCGAWQSRQWACLLVIMLLMAWRLFTGHSGFGLFKLAMFSTPLLAATMGSMIPSGKARNPILALVTVFVIGWAAVTQVYVRASLPDLKNTIVEMPYASSSRGAPPNGKLAYISDIANAPVAKLAVSGWNVPPVTFLSRDFLENISGYKCENSPVWMWNFVPGPSVPKLQRELSNGIATRIYTKEMIFDSSFKYIALPKGDISPRFLTSQAETLSYNKLNISLPSSESLYQQIPLHEIRNHLIFITTDQGAHYYAGAPGVISVYKSQPDVYRPRSYFFGIGRHLLFEILNPSATFRVRLSMTDSIIGQGKTYLPEQAAVRGADNSLISLNIKGAGSANVYSAPLKPAELHQRYYIALDLGRPVFHLPSPYKDGLNSIYNTVVNIDPRLINGYCRDISLITEEDYQKIQRPLRIKTFPLDLIGDSNVEYSGIYEDGWISKSAFIVLGRSKAGGQVEINGTMPALPDKSLAGNIVTILINGQVSATAKLDAGPFAIKAGVPSSANITRIDINFSLEGQLPAGDLRPVAALLTSISIIDKK